MNYCAIIQNGYILGFCSSENPVVNAITKEEFDGAMLKYLNAPSSPDGYDYMLRADTMEWELVELPEPEPEPIDDEASPEDYEQALEEMGVNFND